MLTGMSNIISQLLTFLAGTYYARIFGKSSFGIITAIQAIMIYFTIFTLFGLQTYGIREISKSKRKVEKITGEIITFRFIAASLCFFIIFIIISVVNKEIDFKVILLLYGFTLFPQAINLDWFFIGIEEMQYNAVYNIIKNAVPFILVFIFLNNYRFLFLVPLFTLIGLLMSTAYQIYVFLLRKKYKLTLGISMNTAAEYIRYGMPFLLSGILAMVNNYIDRIIIWITRTSSETGLYSASYYVIMFLINIIAIIYTPLFPQYVRLFKSGNLEGLKAFSEKSSRYIAFAALPIVTGGILLSKQLILLLFGNDFIDSYLPFSILMVYILILFFREIYGYQLNAWNMEKKYLKVVSISAMVNLILNLIFAPVFGMVASAIITVVSEIVNLVFMRRAAVKIVKFNDMKLLSDSVLPAVIMSAAVILMKHYEVHVVINISLSAAIYILSLFLLKKVTVKEIKLLFINKDGI